ncbi:MAG: hypothetical protein ACRDTR_04225 [Rubrobacter sp.]
MTDAPECPRHAFVVCGPTASGKSELADSLADGLTELHGHTPTIVVDSMQVYRELPITTNQARRRPAELVGIVSVTEVWTVARHRARAEEVIREAGAHFVLDAGTGMYLNAILLDIPLAPRVSEEHRRRARETTRDEANPRRAARARELALAGVRDRGSIWDGRSLYETTILYLRPERPALDEAISRRTARIIREGLDEAHLVNRMIDSGAPVSAPVLEAVGVRELTGHLSGDLSPEEAEDRMNVRTRQLARRQLRWFDKLARTLEGQPGLHVVTETSSQDFLHGMHDIIGA